MKRSEALAKLEEFCKDLTPDDPKNSARYILDFVENNLKMCPPKSDGCNCHDCYPDGTEWGYE